MPKGIKVLDFCRDVRRLHWLMNWGDAIRVSRSKSRPGEYHFRLAAADRKIVLRGKTTDFKCFEKVFVKKEYHSPFPIDPEVIVDAGANVGMATIYFWHKYPKAKIIAIEPEKSNFELLKRNCGDLPNVTLIQGALWGKETTVDIAHPKAANWSFSVVESTAAGQLQTVTIPGLLKQIGAERINILKVDIEGAEATVFKEETSWLGAVDQIYIELHDWIRPGCAEAFYPAICQWHFAQQISGENIFIKLEKRLGA